MAQWPPGSLSCGMIPRSMKHSPIPIIGQQHATLSPSCLTILRDGLKASLEANRDFLRSIASPILDVRGNPMWSKTARIGETINVKRPKRFNTGDDVA